jgi:hypothetical protein
MCSKKNVLKKISVGDGQFTVAMISRPRLSPLRHTRLNLSTRLISHGTVFFSHSKSASAGLSAAKTISRTAP